MKHLPTVFAGIAVLTIGFFIGTQFNQSTSPLPLSLPAPAEPARPYLAYSIPALHEYSYSSSSIQIERVLEEAEEFTGYLFSYETLGNRISGRINVPNQLPANGRFPVILMNRGWAPESTYTPGTGTNPAARAFARIGYVTIAPDFLGYGESDPEPADSWEARFRKPIHVIELLQTVRTQQRVETVGTQELPAYLRSVRLDPERIGFWGHSNGGQITISVLEILQEPIPATVWAPVTAPFPYSLLFFTDEEGDEGKGFRKWLAEFEQLYDVYDFTITQHVDKLTGPLQIQHGTADEAALVSWSDAFADRVERENDRRSYLREEISESPDSTKAAALRAQVASEQHLAPIEFEFFRYPGVDHNMRPQWDEVVARDLEFFAEHL